MKINTLEDTIGLREIGGICRDILAALGSMVRPGVTALELDYAASRMLQARGAVSAPKLAYNFPGFTCISVGAAVAHGIPGPIPFQEGDLVNIDVSAEKNGYFGDCGASFAIGRVSSEHEKLLEATRRAQWTAMSEIKAGVPIRRVGEMVSDVAREAGFFVIDGLNGHGVGRWIHEEPTIPNKPYEGLRNHFEAGMVVTIEPFLSNSSKGYYQREDGWTLAVEDGAIGAQFEHSFIVTDSAPIVLTV